jgi:galactitol-specific phosphotransferase system IIB component
MDKQDSKILSELTELKDIFIRLQDTTKEIKPIAEKIVSIVGNLDEYEFTEYENKLVSEMEILAEDIYILLDEFYS